MFSYIFYEDDSQEYDEKELVEMYFALYKNFRTYRIKKKTVQVAVAKKIKQHDAFQKEEKRKFIQAKKDKVREKEEWWQLW